MFNIFYSCFRKNWPSNKYPVWLSTNYNAHYEGFNVFNTNNINDSWVSRTLLALKSIDSEFILLLCDDLFIVEPVDDTLIDHTLSYMIDNDIDYCRLNPNNYQAGEIIDGETLLRRVPLKMPYAIDLQKGIFKKEFLIRLLGDGDKTAWEIEAQLLKDSQNAKSGYYQNIVMVTSPILNVVHLVEKGKLKPSALIKLKKHKIKVESKREKMSWLDDYRSIMRSKLMYFINPTFRFWLKRILINN